MDTPFHSSTIVVQSYVIVCSLFGGALLEHDFHASLSVTEELSINAIHALILLASLFLDAKAVLLFSLVVSRMVL